MRRGELATAARPLPLVGQWVARKSVGEGIGWGRSPFPDSRALRRRGALREPWFLPPLTADETKEACGAASSDATGPSAAPGSVSLLSFPATHELLSLAIPIFVSEKAEAEPIVLVSDGDESIRL